MIVIVIGRMIMVMVGMISLAMRDTMITASFSGRFFMHMGGRHEWAFHIFPYCDGAISHPEATIESSHESDYLERT
ncbi:hypothetical protein [Chitinimonas sp. JJ19]|uniref:hypothetical protein n=1 Tax=Chitinimonas sp. JJ19 TaxID=3109352 RepID=UPI001A522072|nr:hypothetical protein [Chitinimonas sp.]